MSIECYYISGSPFAWRALLGLAFKGLDFKMTALQASEGEHKKPDFLALNPRGKVPALTDGDTTVYESLAILAYLDRQYPKKPLFGATPEASALIWQRVMELENYLLGSIGNLGRAVFRGTVDGNEEALNEDIESIKSELALMSDWLGANDYLAGDSISAADLTAYPGLALMARVLGNQSNEKLKIDFLPIADHFPAVAAWMTRVEAMPGFGDVYPPHWKEQKAAE